MVELKYVSLNSKMAGDKGMFGQKYASKEKMYIRQNAFMIPKSSPLQARKQGCNPIVNNTLKHLNSISITISARFSSGNLLLAGNWSMSKDGE